MNLSKLNYQVRIMLKALLFSFILSVFIIVILPDPKKHVYGLVFSTLITILNFRLMCISIEKAICMSQKKIRAFIATNYGIRTFIYGIVLAIAFIADYLSFYTAIIGLFSIRIIIFIDVFFTGHLSEN